MKDSKKRYPTATSSAVITVADTKKTPKGYTISWVSPIRPSQRVEGITHEKRSAFFEGEKELKKGTTYLIWLETSFAVSFVDGTVDKPFSKIVEVEEVNTKK